MFETPIGRQGVTWNITCRSRGMTHGIQKALSVIAGFTAYYSGFTAYRKTSPSPARGWRGPTAISTGELRVCVGYLSLLEKRWPPTGDQSENLGPAVEFSSALATSDSEHYPACS